MNQSNKSGTTLSSPWLQLAQVAWILLTAVTLIIFGLESAAQLDAPLPSCTTPGAACVYWTLSQEDLATAQQVGVNPNHVRLGLQASIWLAKLTFFLLAVLIFWRSPTDWMAMLVSFMLISFVLEGVGSIGFDFSLGSVVLLLGGLVFFVLPFVFPDGRFVPGWLRWPSLLILPSLVLLQIVWFEALYVGIGIWFLLVIYAVAYRYRYVSGPVERQQLKWVMAGFLGWGIGFLLQFVVGLSYPVTEPSPQRLAFLIYYMGPLYLLSLMVIPLTITIAIRRYGLWNIDVIIRKTLVYVVLTGLLALVYSGSVILLQASFGAAIDDSPLFVVLSTLLIAALFTPLRRRVQALIDRRFYRHKYDAQQVLAQFAQTARDEVSMDRLTVELIHVVQETMQPERVFIWLKSSGEGRA